MKSLSDLVAAFIWVKEIAEGLFTQKSSYTPPKNPQNPKQNPKKFKDFFEDLKSVHLIWERTTPRIQCLKPFLFIKSSYTKKDFEKSEKSKKIQGFFLGFKIRTPFGSEQPHDFSVLILFCS